MSDQGDIGRVRVGLDLFFNDRSFGDVEKQIVQRVQAIVANFNKALAGAQPFVVKADVKEFEKSLRDIQTATSNQKEIEVAARLKVNAEDAAIRVQKALDQVSAATNKTLARDAANFEKAETRKTQVAIQNFNLQQKFAQQGVATVQKAKAQELAAHEKAITAEIQATQRRVSANAKAIDKELADFKRAKEQELAAQEKLGAQLAASINRRFPELAKQRQQQFDALVGNASGLTTGLEEAAEATGPLTGGIGALDRALGKVGLSVSGVAILLGAGFAQGVAGAVQVAANLAGKIQDLAEEFVTLNRQSSLTFGLAGQDVRDFADTADSALSRTRNDLLATANEFGLFGRSIDLPEQALADFAITLTEVTSILERRRGGFDDLADAQQAVQSALGGSDEALRQLGVSAEDFREKAEEAFGKLPDILTASERAIAALGAVFDEAADAVIEDGEKASNVLQAIGRGASAFGAAFADALTEDQIEKFDEISRSIELVGRGLTDTNEDISDFQRGLQGIGSQFGDFGSASTQFEENLAAASEQVKNLTFSQLLLLRSQAEGTAGAEKFVGVIDDEIARRREASAAIEEQKQKILEQIDVQKLNEEAFRRNASAILSVKDAFRQLDEARTDGLRNIARAQEAFRRTVEDNLLREQELRIDIAREQEDILIDLNRAEEDVQSAREDRFFRLRDAERQLADARLDSFRGIRDATERLEDFERNSARKLFDLKKKEAKARKEEVRDTLAAQLAVEDALARGDAVAERSARLRLSQIQQDKKGKEAIEEAELALAREMEDQEIELGRLRRDLKEERLDGLREIKRAEEDLEQAVIEGARQVRDAMRNVEDANLDLTRANEDAIRSLHELEVERNRALADGLRDIEDAERNMRRAVASANRAIQRLSNSLGITIDRLKIIIDDLDIIAKRTSGPNAITGGIIAERQHGGPLAAGQLSIVGERGPELFIPNRNGTVISNEDILRVFRKLDAGRGSQTSIVVQESVDGPATARWIEAQLAQGMNT